MALAVMRHRESDRVALDQPMDDWEKASIIGGWIEADVRFHAQLVVVTGSPFLGALLATVNELLMISCRRTIACSGVVAVLNGHRRILQCIGCRGGEGVRREMLRHQDEARADVLQIEGELL